MPSTLGATQPPTNRSALAAVQVTLTRREIVSVAEDRAQRLRNHPHGRQSAGQVPIYPKAFEAPVKPVRPLSVGVGIGDKGTVLALGGSAH
jgi:hypothetical protein